MRVLVIVAHPLPESFHAAQHRDVLAAVEMGFPQQRDALKEQNLLQGKLDVSKLVLN